MYRWGSPRLPPHEVIWEAPPCFLGGISGRGLSWGSSCLGSIQGTLQSVGNFKAWEGTTGGQRSFKDPLQTGGWGLHATLSGRSPPVLGGCLAQRGALGHWEWTQRQPSPQSGFQGPQQAHSHEPSLPE